MPDLHMAFHHLHESGWIGSLQVFKDLCLAGSTLRYLSQFVIRKASIVYPRLCGGIPACSVGPLDRLAPELSTILSNLTHKSRVFLHYDFLAERVDCQGFRWPDKKKQVKKNKKKQQVDSKRTASGQQVDSKWTASGQQEDSKWTASGQQVDSKRTASIVVCNTTALHIVDSKCANTTYSGLMVDFEEKTRKKT
jgi:hypothetical protein